MQNSVSPSQLQLLYLALMQLDTKKNNSHGMQEERVSFVLREKCACVQTLCMQNMWAVDAHSVKLI